jgi:hypothetical protein
MLPAVLSDYNAPVQDVRPVRDPTTQLPAARYNRLAEDTAQGTRTAPRAEVTFLTSSGGTGTISAANVTHFSVWGSGSSMKPTVAKTATGKYTLTWPATAADGLVGVENMESVAVTESIVFTMPVGAPNVRGTTAGWARVASIASNVATVEVFDATGSLSDLGGAANIDLALR